MAIANVRQYVVVTQEKYERHLWRSTFYVGVDDPDPASMLFQEADCRPAFETADAAAALRSNAESTSQVVCAISQ